MRVEYVPKTFPKHFRIVLSVLVLFIVLSLSFISGATKMQLTLQLLSLKPASRQLIHVSFVSLRLAE